MAGYAENSGYKQRAKNLYRTGNRRHVIVEKDGNRLVYLPLTIVVLAALLAVWLVVILAVIAVLNGYRITLEPDEPETDAAEPTPVSPQSPEQMDETDAASATTPGQ